MIRDSIVHSEDSAKRLDFNTLQGLCTFTLRLILRPYIKWDETFQKKHSTIWIWPYPLYRMAEPLILLNQDRAHNVIRLHWKYFNHGSHINPFNPEWPSWAVPELHIFTSMCPRTNLTHLILSNQSTQVVHFSWSC
jgi:hypothetical protein